MISRKTYILAAAAMILCCGSCQKSTPEETDKFGLTLVTNSSNHNKGQSFILIASDGPWNLGIVDTVDWASVSKTSGNGDATAQLSWDENKGKTTRSLTLCLSNGKKEEFCTFTQTSETTESSIVSDPVSKWMELPAFDDSSLYFITHPMTIDSKKTRNFSYCWDKENLVARWVAYPLNSTLLKGSCGRSEAWGLDPRIPRKYQPVIFSAFGWGWARGHQLPSADRQILAYNKETYYGVNITAQNYDFNGGAWVGLESYVRTRARSLDTLYVVTGCTVEGSSSTVRDNDGKTVRVPSGYFKALLGYSKKKTIGSSTGGYSGIAFYYKNENYSASFMNAAITIGKLEDITGFDFFANLPGVIGSGKTETVETTIENWWKN